jgi:ParB family chromosome partitioning protein
VLASIGLTAAVSASVVRAQELIQCPIERIDRGHNPREYFDPQLIEALAHSIGAHGVIDPIVVRRRPHERYDLVAGERRWLAAQKAGLRELPAIIVQIDEEELDFLQFDEQHHRQDWNEIEYAKWMQRMLEKHNLTQEQLAGRIRKNPSHVSVFLALLKSPEAVQEMLKTGQLSSTQALLIAKRPAGEQLSLAQRAVSEGLNTIELRRKVRKNKDKSAQIRDLERRFQRRYGLRVQVALGRKQGSGEVRLRFGNLDELDRLIELALPSEV